jgi:hypothetical protein
MALREILTGGFLAGKRTYLLAALAVLTELIRWAVGDQSLGALLDHLPTMLGELSIATLRAGVANMAEDAGVTASLLADLGKTEPKTEPEQTPPQWPGLNELIEAYEAARDIRPHLLIEFGHNRITDWMVHVWDSTGVGIEAAPKIICVQETDPGEAALAAIAELKKLFPQAFEDNR